VGWWQITDNFHATMSGFPQAFGDLVLEADVTEAATLGPHHDACLTEP
jgi:hypothetical protein